MKMSLLIVLVLLSLNVFSQIDNDWTLIGKANDGNTYYIRSKYVSKVSGILKVWVKVKLVNYTKDNVDYPNCVLMVLENIDCNLNRKRDIKMIFYSSSGDIIDQSGDTEDLGNWEDNIPESTFEVISNKACQLFNKK